jgi:cytochrome c-type biogenesis protein CcmF
MSAELGQVILLLALLSAVALGIFPMIGARTGNAGLMAMATRGAVVQASLVGAAFALLTLGFMVNDFSIEYVALNSNSLLPREYRFSAVWGAHEGSLLLWELILSMWTLAVALFSKALPADFRARVLGVLGWVSVGFLLFIIYTSNPFGRILPPAIEGRDLNPLLQDPGLIIHPPMLYMGYVGFAVAFAFAVAALLGGQVNRDWVRWSRPWTHVAWAFLTFGIALGSWWAYYELGWGGWWFWDPVENASFMPWLVGTALIHSLAVTEKRGAFKAWTVLLAIFAFSLSLLGTFLVRSGVLTSVHAFATDPERGVFILLFLGVVIGGSLLLYSWRASEVRSTVRFNLISREAGLLLNNVLLVVAAASILLGTLYPLILDALGLGKISVGPPYFNSVFIPLTLPLAALVGVGAFARWRQDSAAELWRKLRLPLLASVVAGVAYAAFLTPFFSWGAALGMVLAFWVALATLAWLRAQMKQGNLFNGASRGRWGMVLGHLGIGVFIVGITLTSIYSSEKDIRLEVGQSYSMGGYAFTFEGASFFSGPNYNGYRGQVSIANEGKLLTTLNPEKRNYRSGMPMTEAGIDAGLTRDLFVALGEPLGNEGAWSLRIYHKPFVRWIWLGGLLMALGGLLAASDRRYFRLAKKARMTMEQGA